MVSAGTHDELLNYHAPRANHEPLGHRSADPRLTFADMFVVAAMAIIVAALAISLIAQFGLDWPAACAVSGAVFFAMLGGHMTLRRNQEAPLGDRRSRHWASEPRQPGPADVAAADTMTNAKLAGASDHTLAAPHAPAPERGVDELPASITLPEPPVNSAGAGDRRVDLQGLDFANFRPRSPADLTAMRRQPAASEGEPASNIDDMIKRLAYDIEAGRKPSQPSSGQPSDVGGPKSRSSDGALDGAMPGALAHEATQSLAAGSAAAPLKGAPPPLPAPSLAPEMRTPEPALNKSPPTLHPPTMIAAARELGPAPQLPKPQTATAKLAAIADALTDEQMDVYLETINALEDYRTQHFEVSVRLRLSDGNTLDNDGFISETRGTGLLPLLEAVKVSSTKRLAVQMIQRGRRGAFFSTVDGEALADQQFSEDIDTITAGDQQLAARLVLAFSQADVRSLTRTQMLSLEAIAALGFRFSIEAITDLDMDFEALGRKGFAFAKLDADVFLQGLPTGTSRVPASDICRYLGGAGLALIVGNISSEALRTKILSCGAVLGQGVLFGTPRPVRSDIMRPGEQRASGS